MKSDNDGVDIVSRRRGEERRSRHEAEAVSWLLNRVGVAAFRPQLPPSLVLIHGSSGRGMVRVKVGKNMRGGVVPSETGEFKSGKASRRVTGCGKQAVEGQWQQRWNGLKK